MFLEKQSTHDQNYYSKMLGVLGSLSRLFSSNNAPYLGSRVAENLFCKAFKADNLSRSDVSADATKGNIGIGIKTFLEGNERTLQKIAEFNRDHKLFRELKLEEKILKISELRNERLGATKRIFSLNELIYHCIVRKSGAIRIYEVTANPISINKIKNISLKENVLSFSDSLEEYSFNIAKSTLYKRFTTQNILLDVPVKIIDDPFEVISGLLQRRASELVFSPVKEEVHIFLPLYSVKSEEKIVPEKSGLNQWNASGRPRNSNEMYIPIPSWIHKKFPDFFPQRDSPFNVSLVKELSQC